MPADLKDTDGGALPCALSFRRLHESRWLAIAIGTVPASASVVASSADDSWNLAGECGRCAEEAQESATRIVFRQMAKVWPQLAFGQHFKPPAENDAAAPGKSLNSITVWQSCGGGAPPSRDAAAPSRARRHGSLSPLNDAFRGPGAIISMRASLAKSEVPTRQPRCFVKPGGDATMMRSLRCK
jgi:hypothetical protein